MGTYVAPHGFMIKHKQQSNSGKLMRVLDTANHLLGRGVQVGDVLLSAPLGEAPPTAADLDVTQEGMGVLGATGVFGSIMPPPPEVGVPDSAAKALQQFSTAFVVLPASSSKIRPYHGMTAAQLATVSTREEDVANGAPSPRLAAVGQDVRADCEHGLYLVKVFLPTGVTSLAQDTPLCVYGTSQGALASVALCESGARVVGRLRKAISGATANAVTLALVEFDGVHGFGMVVRDPSP